MSINYKNKFPILFKEYKNMLKLEHFLFVIPIRKQTKGSYKSFKNQTILNNKYNYKNQTIGEFLKLSTDYKHFINSKFKEPNNRLYKILNSNNKAITNSMAFTYKNLSNISTFNAYNSTINNTLLKSPALNKALLNTINFNDMLGNITINASYNYSITDSILRNLKYNKTSYFNTFKKFNYKKPNPYFGTDFSRHVNFNQIILPNIHMDLLDKKRVKDSFTATKIINHTTYLKRKDNGEYTDINDVADTYAIYDENWGFDEKEIIQFIKYIQESPSLILGHKIGQKIYTEIENFKIEKFESHDDLTLFRARGTRDNFPLHSSEMGIVPYDISKGGRFDSYGNQLLYTAENEKIALLEVYDYNDNDINYYHIIEYKYKNNLKLADLTKMHNNMLKKILYKPLKNNGQEYILPRFIADCLKRVGYDGFVVKSSKSSLNRDDLNFNFFNNAVSYLEDRDYNILSKNEVESIIECYE